MKDPLRMTVAAVGWAMLCIPVLPVHAQPPCSGFGLSLIDVAQRELTRPEAAPLDFSTWKDSTGNSRAFIGPGKIFPAGRNRVYVVQSGEILRLTLGSGGVLNGVGANFGGINAAAGDGTNVYFINGQDRVWIEPKGDMAILPYRISHDIVFDGQAAWILQDDDMGSLYLVRGTYDATLTPKMKFTSQKVGASDTRMRKLAYDGRFIWAASETGSLYRFNRFKQMAVYKAAPSGAPRALTFDGYAMWLATSSSPTIYRVRAIDGSPLSPVSGPDYLREMAFDGKYMLFPDDKNALLTGYRGCDLAPMPSYKIPPRSEYAVFDGLHYWISSPLLNTVSIR
jgi:hypothetical protein